MTNPRTIPHLRGYPLFGLLPRFRKDTLQTMLDLAACGDIVSFRLGPWRSYLLNHPDYVKYVFETNQRNYEKSQLYERMKPLLGRGLVTSEGDFWLRQRRLAQPVFRHKQILHFVEVIAENTEKMLARWRDIEHPIDISEEMMHLTLDIVVQSLFSSGVMRNIDKLSGAWHLLNEETGDRIWRLLALPKWFPDSKNRRYWQALHELDEMIYQAVAERREDRGEDMGDLFSRLVMQQEGEIDEKLLRDEIITLLSAGHETSSNGLSWTFYMIAQHPQIEARLLAEIEEVLQGRVPVAEDVANLSYTKMVIEESMRLFPPVYTVSRRVIKDDNICGYAIPANSIVFMSQYAMHRHPRYWDNPTQFNPDNFAPDKVEARPRYAYFPFGGGGRICIGNHFAMTEMQIIVAMVMQKFKISLVAEHLVEPQPMITVKPRHGIMAQFSLR